MIHLALLLFVTLPQGPDEGADRAALLKDVKALGVAGVPGPLCVFGPRAFVVVAGGQRNVRAPLVAAARWSKGRVVAFGHGGYLNPRVAGMEALLRNAVRWCAGGRSQRDRPLRIALRRRAPLAAFPKEAGFHVLRQRAGEPIAADVLVADASRIRTAADRRAVQAFVQAGGGLITAQLGWGWQQLNPRRDLRHEHPGNLLLAGAGIAWVDGTLRAGSGKRFPVQPTPDPLLHARRALKALLAHAAGKPRLGRAALVQVQATLGAAMRGLPRDEPTLLARLDGFLKSRGSRRRLPDPKRPLGPGAALDRMLLTWELVRDRDAVPAGTVVHVHEGQPTPGVIRAHPAAAAFPGVVPVDAARITRSVSIDRSVPGWHSTGLYAAPGDVVTLTLPEGPVPRGWHLRIGAHKDRTWHRPRWRRAPEITRTFPISSSVTRGACAFGGLVYVVLPKRAAQGTVQATIAGAVPAPLYILGVTDVTAWRKEIRSLPGPWAEIGSRRIIVTLPSSQVRDLENPASLMQTWNRVLELDEELCGRSSAAVRPERIVCDADISAGYMHAGYPVMTHMDQQRHLVDRSHLLAGNWGLFHELGHNHQGRAWTFGGTGEVTCNLFSLYVYEQLCGQDLQKDSRLSVKRRAELMAGWDFARPDFALWKRKPFLALCMYAQVQAAFGWEPFKKVFREYLALPRDQRPKTDAGKRDQWLVRLSRALGRNLGPFFTLWGIPTSEAARQSLRDLPVWISDEIPRRFHPGG